VENGLFGENCVSYLFSPKEKPPRLAHRRLFLRTSFVKVSGFTRARREDIVQVGWNEERSPPWTSAGLS